MQPFDAVTMKAVLEEAKPLLLNRKIAQIDQLGRDEIILTFRNKAGQQELLLSAHAVYGRLCLTKTDTRRKLSGRTSVRSDEPRSSFLLLLRKHLGAATLVGVEQTPAERVVDFAFSCVDEVGGTSLKVLTAEIMGRHGNLIFWNRSDKTIVAASHFVTKEMSRHREVLVGAPYVRPPVQEKSNVFAASLPEVRERLEQWLQNQKKIMPVSEASHAVSEGEPAEATTQLPSVQLLETFLIANYAGLGRHLSREIVQASFAGLTGDSDWTNVAEGIWQTLSHVKSLKVFRPAMRKDLSGYTILSLSLNLSPSEQHNNVDLWKSLPAVNDLVDEYYRSLATLETYNQTRARMLSESRSELSRAEARLNAAGDLINADAEIDRAKEYGDLILAHLQDIEPGQTQLQCTNLYAVPATEIAIPLNANLSAVQNAQGFYRQFAKGRSRQRLAKLTWEEATHRVKLAQANLQAVESATSIDELQTLRKHSSTPKPPSQPSPGELSTRRPRAKMKLMTLTSADGWTIYVGRNRHENDYLLSRVGQPQDIWLHILGQSGAHVLVKVPGSKQEPPLATLREAAQAAARFSKTAPNTKVRVVYTHCRNLRKVGGNKPGVVRYENEKTLEVDV